jgi:hypothetical protein
MPPSVKLVTMNNSTPHESVPPTTAALAEKLYPGNARGELLEDGCESKLFLDYEDYHDVNPSAEEQRRVAGYVQYEAEMLKMLVTGLTWAEAVELELSFTIVTLHGETPNGRCKMSFRSFFSIGSLPFTSIQGLKSAAYANRQHERIPWDMSVYSRRRLLAYVNGGNNAADTRLLTM